MKSQEEYIKALKLLGVDITTPEAAIDWMENTIKALLIENQELKAEIARLKGAI